MDLQLCSLHVGYCTVCLVSLLSALCLLLFVVLITCFILLIIRFMFVLLFCMFCVFCVRVLYLPMYIVVYFLPVYNFTDHRHRVETHLQLRKIISYYFIQKSGQL